MVATHDRLAPRKYWPGRSRNCPMVTGREGLHCSMALRKRQYCFDGRSGDCFASLLPGWTASCSPAHLASLCLCPECTDHLQPHACSAIGLGHVTSLAAAPACKTSRPSPCDFSTFPHAGLTRSRSFTLRDDVGPDVCWWHRCHRVKLKLWADSVSLQPVSIRAEKLMASKQQGEAPREVQRQNLLNSFKIGYM